MTRTRVLLAAAAIVAAAVAVAPIPVAPGWTAVTFPLVALFWAGEIQVWISQPRRGAEGYLRPAAAGTADAHPAAPATSAYLDAVDAALGLPAQVRAEIRAELTDHLADSVAALEAAGLAPDSAVREALARLGRADELGRQLRSAHQSTGRLLAGAAGGVWSAGVGVVQGFLGVFGVLVLCLYIAGAIYQKPFSDVFGFWLGPGLFGSSDPAAGSLLGCMLAWVPAFLAGRRSVRSSARLSRRPARQIRWLWALVGALVLGWFVMFELTVTQGWLVVLFEVAVPVLFAAGALAKPDVDLHLPPGRSRWVLALAGLLIGGLLVGDVVPIRLRQNPGGVIRPADSSLGYDRIAPAATTPCSSTNPGPTWMNSGCSIVGGFFATEGFDMPEKPVSRLVHEKWGVLDEWAFARYTNVQFEIWRAAADSGQRTSNPSTAAVDPTERTAYLTVPATLAGAGLEFRADLGKVRAERWLVFVTGVGIDGHRYRLGEPADLQNLFSGTIWDWVTASD